MKKLIFQIRCSFTSEDGSIFGFTFSESQWCMPDAPSVTVGNEIIVYAPTECIERAVRTFVSGLTDPERKMAAKSLQIDARQAESERL
jgi:hypothetical protein